MAENRFLIQANVSCIRSHVDAVAASSFPLPYLTMQEKLAAQVETLTEALKSETQRGLGGGANVLG